MLTISCLLAFPRTSLNTEVCVVSPSSLELDQLSVHAHWLSTNAHSLCPWGHGHRASHRVEVCVAEECGALEVPMGQLGASAGKMSPAVHGQFS